MSADNGFIRVSREDAIKATNQMLLKIRSIPNANVREREMGIAYRWSAAFNFSKEEFVSISIDSTLIDYLAVPEQRQLLSEMQAQKKDF